MTVQELVNQIEAGFKAREDEISQNLAEAKELKSKNLAKSKELTAREKALEARIKEVDVREQAVKKIESVDAMRKQAEADRLDAASKLESAKKFNKDAEEKLGDAKTALAEQSKREIALNAEKAKYRDEIKKELIEKTLNLR